MLLKYTLYKTHKLGHAFLKFHRERSTIGVLRGGGQGGLAPPQKKGGYGVV